MERFSVIFTYLFVLTHFYLYIVYVDCNHCGTTLTVSLRCHPRRLTVWWGDTTMWSERLLRGWRDEVLEVSGGVWCVSYLLKTRTGYSHEKSGQPLRFRRKSSRPRTKKQVKMSVLSDTDQTRSNKDSGFLVDRWTKLSRVVHKRGVKCDGTVYVGEIK